MNTPGHIGKSLKRQVESLEKMSLFELNVENVTATDIMLLSEYLFESSNHVLVKFVGRIKQQDRLEVVPMTLRNYIFELQR